MLHVHRRIRPIDLVPPDYEKTVRNDLKKFYAQPESKRRQLQAPHTDWPMPVYLKLLKHLSKEFNGKCAYCESALPREKTKMVDLFRPCNSAKNLDGSFALDHYWWFSLEWRNMHLACIECCRSKGHWFPVNGGRTGIELTYLRTLRSEDALLINPSYDAPAEHLTYDRNGRMRAISGKGETTIKLLSLNRKELIAQRRQVIESLLEWEAKLFTRKIMSSEDKRKDESLSPIMLILSKLAEPNPALPFAGLFYFLFFQWKQKYPAFFTSQRGHHGKIVHAFLKKAETKVWRDAAYVRDRSSKNEMTKSVIASKTKQFNIAKIEVQNFKTIKSLQVEFPVARSVSEPWLMLLGENGVGKSSLLQAVTMTLIGGLHCQKLKIRPTDILRMEEQEGFVRIWDRNGEMAEMKFDAKNILHNNRQPLCYVQAYGSTRIAAVGLIKPDKTNGPVRIRNLFRADVALFAEDWLINLARQDKRRFDFACRALKELLQKEFRDPKLVLREKNREIWLHFSHGAKPQRLKTLSDGYKSVVCLASDIMQHVLQRGSTIEVAEGLVVIDEIGTHLHPRWKMRVVESFRRCFPKMQFIVTTHDPLCLKGLRRGEVLVLEKGHSQEVLAVDNLPDPTDYTAGQLLSSRFFGLLSTIEEDLELAFSQYYHLLGLKTRNQTQEKKLLALQKKLKDREHMGDSLREELAFTAADTILAEEKADKLHRPVEVLQNQTIEILRGLWNNIAEQNEQIS